MRKVAIVGAGQTKYGDFPEKGIKELFVEAFKEMLKSVDKGVDLKAIENAYIGTLSTGSSFQVGQSAPFW